MFDSKVGLKETKNQNVKASAFQKLKVYEKNLFGVSRSFFKLFGLEAIKINLLIC